MKTLLLILSLSLTPYYHVPQWFDTNMANRCTGYEGVTFCYLASADTSGRIMIGVEFRQYFPEQFDTLWRSGWTDTTVYYLSIENFVR